MDGFDSDLDGSGWTTPTDDAQPDTDTYPDTMVGDDLTSTFTYIDPHADLHLEPHTEPPQPVDPPAAPPAPAPDEAHDPIPAPAPVPSPDDIDLTEPAPEDVPAPPAPVEDTMHGNPTEWVSDWFYQVQEGYCGPSVAGQVIAEFTGQVTTDPQALADRALELGLTDDISQGMTLPALQELLADQGVPTTIETGSMDDLRAALDRGEGITAMVDSGEIWYPGEEIVEDDMPDHVVVVAGIDDARGVVILSDPGSPDGNQEEVPIAQFEDAWNDSNHTMLVTDEPDPDLIQDAEPSAASLRAPRGSIVLDLCS